MIEIKEKITPQQVRIGLLVSELLARKYTKFNLSDIMGISRPTLDKRIELNNWKKGEIAIIKTL